MLCSLDLYYRCLRVDSFNMLCFSSSLFILIGVLLICFMFIGGSCEIVKL